MFTSLAVDKKLITVSVHEDGELHADLSLGTGSLDVFWSFSPSFVPLVTKLKKNALLLLCASMRSSVLENCIQR